ncbi:MAG: hypothetical protein DI586_09480 [Micavibrio aeruginosavorus]|uniref:Uncharacterized protein n=1 Tax=Micavibrio aeruginosavorus TaxID=349221 RepID=A0A2W5FL89_9BACT|nr:MAG: hypothetical protein DI586_09480 [Micavibrio aeruginosavorus]
MINDGDIEALIAKQGWAREKLYLYILAHAGPELDSAAAELRENSHSKLADQLDKLQADVGVELMAGLLPEDEAAPGPETASLEKSYEPITKDRLNILADVCNLVIDLEVKDGILTLMQQIFYPPEPLYYKKPGFEPLI